MNTDLTKEQKDYAVFLPALSGFYATFVGKQRFEEYVDYNRIPYANGMESINWLNKKDGLFNYHWTLYSASRLWVIGGHCWICFQCFRRPQHV